MFKRTILIVDDQEVNRRILGKLLSDRYEILEAENGKRAIECLRAEAERISAVLLDIIMPEMDGYEVLTAMRADAELSKIPVIVSSQKDSSDAEIRALSLGAQDFIAKPYNASIIRHRLENLIRLRETAAVINKIERDELTGLYNKTFFLEKARDYLDRHPDRPVDLVCLGIEHFKLVNDIYGTRKGDELLRHMAGVIKEASREINICGHFTGDIFFTLLPHSDQYTNDQLRPWLDKINAFPIDMDLKLHCGIYGIHDRSKAVIVMCDRAQLAANKNKGRYDDLFCYYDDSIRQKMLEEQFITSTMQTALEQRQFEVYYQPKYDLRTETVVGAEALVRWNHPERGFLSPGRFIPLFEKNGFITQLDRYVWEETCRAIRAWRDKGDPWVAISVNVSRADLYNPKLTDILLDLIGKYQVPMRYLHLEITESAYTDNPQQIITAVGRLRTLGFVIEMDDFGSGYSSLNMLAEMPVDVLKLDIRFIQAETSKPSAKGILSFIISLAKWLNLAVVAEGVETKEQIAVLQSMDCTYVQGFYYAKPMPESAFEALLQTAKVTEMVCTSRTAAQYVAERKPLHALADGRQMLIVDDIESNRAVLASIFLDEYQIVERENGRDAWDYLTSHVGRVDLVMLDLLMPVMDGFQLLEKIRGDERTKDLPVVITSQGNGESERHALQIRADDFISKPYNPEIVRHRVHNVMARYQLEKMRCETPALLSELRRQPEESKPSTAMERIESHMEALRPYFDIVRLVDPRRTFVYEGGQDPASCDMRACFSVWGKTARCSNCISLRALETKGRLNKLEYGENGLHFVIAEYLPYGLDGLVLELVSKLNGEAIDNVFDKELFYMDLDAMNQKLENDPLTGTYNRRHIDRHLSAYVSSARKRKKDLGVAMVDVDCFKALNDAQGHLFGDHVLRKVAEMLKSNIAQSQGDFVARFGGDEFLIVCRDIPSDVFVRRIAAVTQLAKHIILDAETQPNIGISAGCVCLSEYPNDTAMELIKHADDRLYMAKKAGRGRVVCTRTLPAAKIEGDRNDERKTKNSDCGG